MGNPVDTMSQTNGPSNSPSHIPVKELEWLNVKNKRIKMNDEEPDGLSLDEWKERKEKEIEQEKNTAIKGLVEEIGNLQDDINNLDETSEEDKEEIEKKETEKQEKEKKLQQEIIKDLSAEFIIDQRGKTTYLMLHTLWEVEGFEIIWEMSEETLESFKEWIEEFYKRQYEIDHDLDLELKEATVDTESDLDTLEEKVREENAEEGEEAISEPQTKFWKAVSDFLDKFDPEKASWIEKTVYGAIQVAFQFLAKIWGSTLWFLWGMIWWDTWAATEGFAKDLEFIRAKHEITPETIDKYWIPGEFDIADQDGLDEALAAIEDDDANYSEYLLKWVFPSDYGADGTDYLSSEYGIQTPLPEWIDSALSVDDWSQYPNDLLSDLGLRENVWWLKETISHMLWNNPDNEEVKAYMCFIITQLNGQNNQNLKKYNSFLTVNQLWANDWLGWQQRIDWTIYPHIPDWNLATKMLIEKWEQQANTTQRLTNQLNQADRDDFDTMLNSWPNSGGTLPNI